MSKAQSVYYLQAKIVNQTDYENFIASLRTEKTDLRYEETINSHSASYKLQDYAGNTFQIYETFHLSDNEPNVFSANQENTLTDRNGRQ